MGAASHRTCTAQQPSVPLHCPFDTAQACTHVGRRRDVCHCIHLALDTLWCRRSNTVPLALRVLCSAEQQPACRITCPEEIYQRQTPHRQTVLQRKGTQSSQLGTPPPSSASLSRVATQGCQELLVAVTVFERRNSGAPHARAVLVCHGTKGRETHRNLI